MSEQKKSQSTKPLWAAGGETIDRGILTFCAGEDATLDNELLLDDCVASRAHVKGLALIDILSSEEERALTNALLSLEEKIKEGQFFVGEDDEDGHSAIEGWLTQHLGDLGKKIHTGRSRNDQILIASRLWLKRHTTAIARGILRAIQRALEKAEETRDQPMPGYTHLQQAVPSSVGFWFAGHAESWLEDAEAILHLQNVLDTCPLGTAAGYGVNLPLARENVAHELDFAKIQLNGIAAQNSRGRFELHAIQTLMMWMLSVRRFAWDLSLFSTHEFGFITLPARWCTGSSIMPNKRNPDVVELMRAQYAVLSGAQSELSEALSLPSGYQRDLQVTKGPMIRGVKAARAVVALLEDLVGDISFNAAACERALSVDLLATDRAVELAKEGVPFRDAYREVKTQLGQSMGDAERIQEMKKSVKARISLGAPGNLGLEHLASRLKDLEAKL